MTAPDNTISESLAEFTTSVAFEDLPDEVVSIAKLHLLDSLGIAFASTTYSFAESSIKAIKAMSGRGLVPVIGSREFLPPREAALINGILIHGLDFDDTHGGSIVHASASAAPAAISAAAQTKTNGRRFLLAYVLAIETSARLGMVVNGGFHQAGFHPTAVAGIFGAALAAGLLNASDAESLVNAQGIALSMSGGTLEFLTEGAWTKRLHPGWAAFGGLTAIALADGGFQGPRRPYEGSYGLYATHLGGAAIPELEPIVQNLGKDWEVLNMAIKPLPVCHFAHAASDAVRALLPALENNLEQVEEIVVRVPAPVIPVICEPESQKRRPRTSYEAQFSLPYIVAATLCTGGFGLDELDEKALLDPRILALADKVRHEADPNSGYPKYFSGEVELRLMDGRRLRHREDYHRGSGARPIERDDIIEKFHSTAGRAISGGHRTNLLNAIENLDSTESIQTFFDLLSVP